MNHIDILSLNVPSLRALVTIYSSGSLSRAADELGVTQSTLSHTLGRLRQAFGDELFLRRARGVVPTARCDAIVSGISEILEKLEVLAEPPSFDPARTTHSFTVSCNFYERVVLLPHLLKRFRKDAPHARLRVIQSNLRGHEQLEQGLCDILISPMPADTAGLYQKSLLEERYACFVDRHHVLANGALTLEAYASAHHIAVNYDGGWRPFYRAALDALGISITPTIELPSFGAMGSFLEDSDLILTAPSALAAVLLPKAVRLEAPFNASFEVFMFWTARQHASPANIWLRGLVADTVRAIKAHAN